MKSIKALGLVVLTALALTAFSGAAMASPSGLSIIDNGKPEFHSEVYPAAISGEQVGKLKFGSDAGKVACGSATFTLPSWAPGGKIIDDASELLLSPTFKNCTLAGITATVTTSSGCMFTVAVTDSSPFTGHYFICEVTAKIPSSGCTVAFEPQTVNGSAYKNVGSGASATVEAFLTHGSIRYKVSGGGLCPFPVENGQYADGSIEGALSLRAQS